MRIWGSWKYKNLTLVFLGVIAAVVLSRVEVFRQFLLHLGGLGYIGAFITGVLFVSTFTFATGAMVLFTLTQTLSPLEIGIIAGLGAILGDFLIFKFVKDRLINELEDIYNQVDSKHHFVKVLHSKYFGWTLPVVGTIIIASPLPDELGVSLIGISKMKTYEFLVASFLLHAIGIFLVVSASNVISVA